MAQTKKHHRRLSTYFLWLLLFLSAAVFFISFLRIPAFPRRWSILVLLILLAILIFCLILTLYFSRKNMAVKCINGFNALVLLIGGIMMPYYSDRIEKLFDTVTGVTVRINLYTLADSDLNRVTDCKDSVFLTSMAEDGDNQQFAADSIRADLKEEPSFSDRQSVYESVDALYRKEGDVLVMSSAYESIVSDTEGYETFTEDTKIIGWYYRTIEVPASSGKIRVTDEPFVLFIGGNDQTGELSLAGRTDVNMAVTVNPKTHQIALVSLPRDSYIPNPAYEDEKDKLTHLGIKGLDNTVKGIGEVLGHQPDYYILVNFSTFIDIIRAIGGVTIENPYAFDCLDGRHFDEGVITLDPDEALMYVRERKHLPDGDFGRTMHQQIVLRALIQKLTSPEMIIHFDSLLKALEGKFLTSLSGSQIFALCRMQLEENISWNIVNYHVTGKIGSAKCASVSGQKLSVVYPYENQLEFCADVIRRVLKGEEVIQEEIPEGE
ncbi:MAG TPA: hypothetical protein DHW39_00745 [Erysipelotrichaceae bacterium]|nr:hypothetical protein [Erysipelotrichaceae bacterium]